MLNRSRDLLAEMIYRCNFHEGILRLLNLRKAVEANLYLTCDGVIGGNGKD